MCLQSEGTFKTRKKDRFVYKVVKRDVYDTSFEFLFRGAYGVQLSDSFQFQDLSLVRFPAVGFYETRQNFGYMSFPTLYNAKKYCAVIYENNFDWANRICIVRLILRKGVDYEEAIISKSYIGHGLKSIRSLLLEVPEFKNKKIVGVSYASRYYSYNVEKKMVNGSVPYYY